MTITRSPDTDRPVAARARPGSAGGYAARLDGLTAAQKPAAGVAPYLRFVNRPLGRRAAAVADLAGRRPDQVTALSALLSMVALVLLVAVPPGPVLVLTMVVAAAGYVLDSADGQLARLQGRGGPAGEWLDHVVDAGRQNLVHVAVLVALLRWTGLPLVTVLAVTLSFLIVTNVRFFALMLGEQLRRQHGASAAAVSPPVPRVDVRGLLQQPADPSSLFLTFLLLPWPTAFLAVYTSLLAANTLLLAASLRRRHAELTRLRVGP